MTGASEDRFLLLDPLASPPTSGKLHNASLRKAGLRDEQEFWAIEGSSWDLLAHFDIGLLQKR